MHMSTCVSVPIKPKRVLDSQKLLMLVLRTELKSSRSTMMILIPDLDLKAPAFLEFSWLVMLTYYYVDLKMGKL